MSELARVAECAESWVWSQEPHLESLVCPRKAQKRTGVLRGCQAEEDGVQIVALAAV